MVVFDTDKLSVVAKEVINLLKLPENTQISLFEEIRPDWIEHKSHEITFTEAELSTGDILVAQITPTPEFVFITSVRLLAASTDTQVPSLFYFAE
jgi:hypothetical protein